jgi:chromosome segregation ATPase
MRRRTVTAANSLSEVPRPSDIEMQISQLIEARPKLRAAIQEQEHKIEEAELELARTFARDTQTVAKLDVESAYQKNKALEESEERSKQRIEALESILEKINKHLEQLKADFPEAVRVALTQRVVTLEKALLEKGVPGKGIVEEIKKLKAEISKLPKATAKKASSY